MPEFAPVLELSALDGTNGFQISGEAAFDQSGVSVSDAGDVNDDGFADLIIGARNASPNASQSGASYVVFGKAAGFGPNLDLSTLDGSNGFQISGEAVDDYSGLSVSGAGDVNGDGFADVIVGARYADPNGGASGASYVVFGKETGFGTNLDLSTLDGTNGFQISGELADDKSGSVSGAGDVNGDGFGDLIVGAFAADPNGVLSGASYVVFGKASGFGTNLDLSTLDGSNGFQISGEAVPDRSGYSVAAAGDVNGDGFDDLIIGAYTASPYENLSGASYVVFGKASGFGANLNLSDLDGTNGFQISGEAVEDNSGFSVSGAGDVNADGFADLIIGANPADPNGKYSGASYVVFGRGTGFGTNLDLAALDGTNGFQISGEAAGDFSGVSVSGAGDVNGDGFADLIVGASGADLNGKEFGASYVVFGRESGFSANLNLASLDGNSGFEIRGETAGDESGTSVSGAGDLNGDGFADLIVGADRADGDAGASYVIFGHKALIDVVRIGTEIANRINGGVGDDEIAGLSGNDTLLGHEGDDAVGSGSGNDSADGSSGDDVLRSGSGNDTADGGSDDDVVRGGSGNDKLTGGSGDDEIFGNSGTDTITGGAGQDDLSGGSSADLFAYLALSDSTKGGTVRDRILDFVAAQGDEIDLAAIDANTKSGGNQAFNFIGGSKFSGTAGELRFKKALLSGDVNGDGTADFEIELVGVASLSAGDLIL